MKHFEIAANNPNAIVAIASTDNPDILAARVKREREKGFPVLSEVIAVAVVVSRAYWININGQWHRKGS